MRLLSSRSVENSSIISVNKAAELLLQGAVVALPTETVYGLAGRADLDAAIERIFAAKLRPADNPLIVHVANPAQAQALGVFTPTDHILADAFWPGPLTLVLDKHPGVSDLISAGLDTVAVRMPDHPVFMDVLRRVGKPLAAPSANVSGGPSPTTALHVIADHHGTVPVVDGGACTAGLESTVVRVQPDCILLLRPGTITRKQIAAATNLPVVDASATDRRASPGTRHRHYAPRARVQLFFDIDSLKTALGQGASQRIAIVLSVGDPVVDLPWRPLSGDTLYAELRRADELQVDEILVHCDRNTACDEALMDRLLRAADKESEAGNGT